MVYEFSQILALINCWRYQPLKNDKFSTLERTNFCTDPDDYRLQYRPIRFRTCTDNSKIGCRTITYTPHNVDKNESTHQTNRNIYCPKFSTILTHFTYPKKVFIPKANQNYKIVKFN